MEGVGLTGSECGPFIDSTCLVFTSETRPSINGDFYLHTLGRPHTSENLEEEKEEGQGRGGGKG